MPSVGKTHSRRTGGSNSGWTLDRVRVQKGLLALDERIGGLCACEMSALSARIENDPYSGLGEQIGRRALRPASCRRLWHRSAGRRARTSASWCGRAMDECRRPGVTFVPLQIVFVMGMV